MSHDVFISYSSKNKLTADAICHVIEEKGIKCWIAPRDVASGEDWPAQISQAVSECKMILLVFSDHVNKSKHVKREINIACDEDKIIIPFKIDDSIMDGNMKYYLSNKHWIDAYPNPQEKFKDLLEAVARCLGVELKNNLEMMKCPFCFQEILKTSRQCKFCNGEIHVSILSDLMPKSSETVDGDTRECPFCAEIIKKKANVCKHCKNNVEMTRCPICAEDILKTSERCEFCNGEISSSKDLSVKSANIKKSLIVGRYEIITINGDEVVNDQKTGLMWQRSNSQKMIWAQAKSYARDFRLGGFSDWRLPTIDELKTLFVPEWTTKNKEQKNNNKEMGMGQALLIGNIRSFMKRSGIIGEESVEQVGKDGFFWQKYVWKYDGDIYGCFWASSEQNYNDGVWAAGFKYRTVEKLMGVSICSFSGYVRCVRSDKKL